ncbi:MAG: sigma-70 family RNA polymerase sigma factor [Blastocatellia bacterium]
MAEEITRLLVRWSEGDEAALEQLTPMVYQELRKLAYSYLRRHPQQSVLQPTAIVHEAWIKLAHLEQGAWQNRAQFFGLAAKIMRDLLVDHARRRHAEKRGGDDIRLSMTHADQFARQPDASLVALDDALQQLATIKPRHVRIIEMRFFGGLSIEETAQALGVSHATVEREWNFARAWLYKELSNS